MCDHLCGVSPRVLLSVSTMTEVEAELDSRFDDVDVDSILARCERRGPLTFTRKRILYQGNGVDLIFLSAKKSWFV